MKLGTQKEEGFNILGRLQSDPLSHFHTTRKAMRVPAKHLGEFLTPRMYSSLNSLKALYRVGV